jgi:hypothetical protein
MSGFDYTDQVKWAVRGITEASAAYLDGHVLADAVEVHAGSLDSDELRTTLLLLAGVLKISMAAHGAAEAESLRYVRERFPLAPPDGSAP